MCASGYRTPRSTSSMYMITVVVCNDIFWTGLFPPLVPVLSRGVVRMSATGAKHE